VPLIVLSNRSPNGFRSNVAHDHYSLLRTIEDAWGLSCLGQACVANNLSESSSRKYRAVPSIWRTPTFLTEVSMDSDLAHRSPQTLVSLRKQAVSPALFGVSLLLSVAVSAPGMAVGIVCFRRGALPVAPVIAQEPSFSPGQVEPAPILAASDVITGMWELDEPIPGSSAAKPGQRSIVFDDAGNAYAVWETTRTKNQWCDTSRKPALRLPAGRRRLERGDHHRRRQC